MTQHLTIQFTPKQMEGMARANAVRQQMRDAQLVQALRGRTLDEVIEMWWRAQGYTQPKAQAAK